jgi:hypothetical protein
MRVSFDSNAWEKIFDPDDDECAPIRAAISNGTIEVFICEAAFRIEAIKKLDRTAYFVRPRMDFRCDIVQFKGEPHLRFSIGPKDSDHPGLHAAQLVKLQIAKDGGAQFMRGVAWMGLPAPREIRDPTLFVPESEEAAHEREQRQIEVFALIDKWGAGKAAFDAENGWRLPVGDSVDDKKFQKACAEWADGELVCAHIAYQNDILCTDDRGRALKKSIFNLQNRARLTTRYGVTFKTVRELLVAITSDPGADHTASASAICAPAPRDRDRSRRAGRCAR